MRHYLIPVLLLSLIAGCSSVKVGPHRIDVQQGNALDQENVSRLKPGLNRSQVRFLLGTPLVVDPFRNDRWDYVYVFYKAGRLSEQKRITLFFESDTLARIEGDLPEPISQPAAPAVEPKPELQPEPATSVAPPPAALPRAAEPVSQPDTAVQSVPVESQPPATTVPAPAPVVASLVQQEAPKAEQASRPAGPETSVVPPLPSPQNVPAYVDPRPSAELSLQPETDVARIQPDVIPSFPEAESTQAERNAPVLKSLNDWAAAWARRDKTAYFAAYDDRFVPQDGISRAEWENRKRHALDTAKNIEVRVDSPRVDRTEEGTVTMTFNQFYRSDNYSDAVVKQVHMVEQEGRWLIVEEKVLSELRGTRP